MIWQFHDGMTVTVLVNGETSTPFDVTAGVKQGCVIAPTLFLYPVAVTLLSRNALDDGVCIQYHMDDSVFNLWQLSPHSKTSSTVVCDLQYADDAAVISLNPEGLQRTMESSFEAYNRMRLMVSIPKTVTMQSSFFYVEPPCVITAGKAPLKNEQLFCYLGSIIPDDASIDEEINS